ncbi:MAG: DUF4290 domain-containing protein [Bacteroidota bacterium]
MQYKISHEPLKLREYGRNVQMMVDYAKALEDEEERNALTRDIIRIMSSMNPNIREGADFRQKLWDHFFHLADYDINVESEFPMPERDSMFARPPERMPYNNKRSRFRQYGRNVELMAAEAIRMDDEDRRKALVTMILNIMKMHIRTAEKDSNAELIVCGHLKTLTQGELDYQPEEIRFHKFSAYPQEMRQSSQNQRSGGNKKNKNKSHNHKKKRK